MIQTNIHLLPPLEAYISTLPEEFSSIPASRKQLLEELSDFIRQQTAAGQTAELVFICTHNSRRSHFGQIWARVLALYYGLPGVNTYSGGTEATAFHPHAIAALQQAGFVIEALSQGNNPHYKVIYSSRGDFLEVWSKVYTDPANPREGFCAIMTCDEANEACPLVFGAARRLALTYEDPKHADGTPRQQAAYQERCRQIAREMAFVFANINPSAT